MLDHPRTIEYIILIDDACCFTGENNYPSLEGLERVIGDIYPDRIFEVKDDN